MTLGLFIGCECSNTDTNILGFMSLFYLMIVFWWYKTHAHVHNCILVIHLPQKHSTYSTIYSITFSKLSSSLMTHVKFPVTPLLLPQSTLPLLSPGLRIPRHVSTPPTQWKLKLPGDTARHQARVLWPQAVRWQAQLRLVSVADFLTTQKNKGIH